MARTCTICTHLKRKEIDKAILNGTSYRDIAGRYGVSKTSIERHIKAGHISEKIQKAKEKKEEKEALSFDEYLQELNEIDRGSFLEAHNKGTRKEKAEATRTRARTLELLGKAGGQFTTKTEISGPNQGPIEFLNLSDEELEREIKSVISGTDPETE